MRATLLFLFILLTACQDRKPLDKPVDLQKALPEPPKAKQYANERFREVTVKKTAPGKYDVSGQAQVFEAAFSWVVENGHIEIATGHEMTDAGAPEWGNFTFSISVDKELENSVLHVILFEPSAQDGSRQHELPIPLNPHK
ncbi:MAG TPA: Gmad2 immunoglobulin-like domain-containing protein [Flavobacterium sp.]|jgi:hypothetical protein